MMARNSGHRGPPHRGCPRSLYEAPSTAPAWAASSHQARAPSSPDALLDNAKGGRAGGRGGGSREPRSLLDHLGDLQQDLRREGNAQRTSRLHVDDEVELARLLDW
jgi:hypothetical protein